MEYVDGQTLAQILSKLKDAELEMGSPFGPKDQGDFFIRLSRAFADVADGLQHAHSKGVTHRDIKPSNLILDSDGRLRILDFGLARLEGQESLTISGDVVGTPLYMSPEQARRKKIPVDHRTDVYSLGATMYEAICGQPPFRGKDHADTLSQIIERDAIEPRKINPRVPKDLETIVLKCLRKDLGDRYGTAEALAQDLRRFVRGDAVEARPGSGWQRAGRALWRRRWTLAVAGVLAAGFVFGVVLWYRAARAETEQLLLEYRAAVRELSSRLSGTRFRLNASDASKKTSLALPGHSQGGTNRFAPIRHRFAPIRLRELQNEIARDTDSSVKAAVAALQHLVQRLPDLRDGHYHLALAYRLLGRDAESERGARAALAIDPGFVPAAVLLPGPSPWDQPPARALEPNGREPWVTDWLEANQPREPGEKWGARDPERVGAWTRLIERGRAENEPYAGCLLEAYLNRGVLLLESGEPEGALSDFGAAEHLAPESLEPRLLRGKALLMLDRPEAAERLFEELESGESTGGVRSSEVALWVSLVYVSKRDFRSSLRWAEKVPPSRGRDRLLSALHRQAEEYDSALTAARRALEYAPAAFESRRLVVRALLDVETHSPGGCEECLQLVEAAERLAQTFPEESTAVSLVRAATVLCTARLRQFETEDSMKSIQPCWLALTTALASGPAAQAESVLDDFSDGALNDCTPVCWKWFSCCPGEADPLEDGIAMRQTSRSGGWVFANDLTCRRDPGVRVRATVTVGTAEPARGPNLGFTDGVGLWYVANYRNTSFRCRLITTERDDELASESQPAQAQGLDYSQPIVVELALAPTTIEMRMWQRVDGQESGAGRPSEPGLRVQNDRFLVGHPAFGVFDDARESIIVHEVEVTDLAPPPPEFRRGEVNHQEGIDLSDAIGIFGFLFLGNPAALPCEDATDTDDNGTIELTDGVFLLNALFVGGTSPPAPYESCGRDPTEDLLGCGEFTGCP